MRQACPEVGLTTDVIVGYPGETDADFAATRKLMEEVEFDNAFIFRYSPREYPRHPGKGGGSAGESEGGA